MLRLHANKPYHFLLIHCNPYSEGISVILAMHCINALKEHFPNATISFLIHSSMYDFFHNHPFLEHIFCIDTTSNLAGKLKAAKINISISLIADKESTIATFRAGIKTRIGVFKNLFTFLFNYKIKQQRSQSKQHEALYNLDILKPLGCNHITYPKIYLTISEKQEAHTYLESIFNIHSLLDSGYIAIYPGNGLKSIGWSMKNFFFLANELAKTNNVLIVGTPKELESYMTLIALYPNLSNKNLALFANTTTRKILGIISHARLFISNNTTLLHAAVALDVATFSLFPYKSPLCPIRYAPFHNNRKHMIFTPFGIFDANHSDAKKSTLSDHGLNMTSIMPELILNVLYAKILNMPHHIIPIQEHQEYLTTKQVRPSLGTSSSNNQNTQSQEYPNESSKQEIQLQPDEHKLLQNTLNEQNFSSNTNQQSFEHKV